MIPKVDPFLGFIVFFNLRIFLSNLTKQLLGTTLLLVWILYESLNQNNNENVDLQTLDFRN